MSLTIDPGVLSSSRLTSAQLQGAADRGAAYLSANLQPGGMFVYQRNARTGRPVTGQYNLLRHFGSLWAMLDVAGEDPAVRAQAARGVSWAIKRFYGRTNRGGAFRKRNWLATGCSGLALLAMHRLPERSPTVDATCAELVDFLLAIQIDNAADPLYLDFPHKIMLDGPIVDGMWDARTLAIAPFRSNYYTGEILFGLITHLARAGADPDGRLRRAITGCLRTLRARDYGVAERSHWMMYAIRHHVLGGELDDGEVAAMLEWSGRIAASVLASTSRSRSLRSAPTACRVEAQVQFLELARSYAERVADQTALVELVEPVRQQVREDCALLLHLQDMRTGGFIGSVVDPIMQIDCTQHAISALQGAAPLLR